MDRLEEYNIECMLINDNQAQEDELIKEYERNSMDRLISEQAVLKIIDNLKANFTCYDSVTLDEVASHIKAISSAEYETEIVKYSDDEKYKALITLHFASIN